MDTGNSAFLHQSNCVIAVVVDDGEGIYPRNLKSSWSGLNFTINNGDSKWKEFVIDVHTEHGLQILLENRPLVCKHKFISVHKPHEAGRDGLYVSPMWVRFEVPPMWSHQCQYPNQQVAAYLGLIVGDDPMFIDDVTKSPLRVRVKVNLSLPMIQKTKLESAGHVWTIHCTYEGVYRHCTKCGSIGQAGRGCKFTKAKRLEDLNKLKERISEKKVPGDIEIEIKDEKPGKRKDNAKGIIASIHPCRGEGKHRVTYNHFAIPGGRRFELGGPSNTAADVDSNTTQNQMFGGDSYNPQPEGSYIDQIYQQNESNPHYHGIDREDPMWDFDNLKDYNVPLL